MRILHNIGTIKDCNYTTPDAVKACDEVLTFDGVYRNVWEHRNLLRGKKVILFIMGDYIGGTNSFNHTKPFEHLADWNQIMDLVMQGAELGWHGWSHKDLRGLSDEEIVREITPPFPMKHFAYPYGAFNDRVIELVKQQYENGFSVGDGDDSQFQKLRKYL